jgi:hypothetical protein
MGKQRPASERQSYPAAVEEAEAIRAPEQKVPREQLPNDHAKLKTLAGE